MVVGIYVMLCKHIHRRKNYNNCKFLDFKVFCCFFLLDKLFSLSLLGPSSCFFFFLIWLLYSPLGGNCLTAMIATISLEPENLGESISTCRFAQRVACIANNARYTHNLLNCINYSFVLFASVFFCLTQEKQQWLMLTCLER